MNELYYKLYLDRDDLACVVCMQDFDEYEYDQDRFIADRRNRVWQYKFESETEAIKVLNEIVKREHINPRCRNANFDHIYK